MAFSLRLLLAVLFLLPWVCYGIDYERHYTVKLMTIPYEREAGFKREESKGSIAIRYHPGSWPEVSQLTAYCMKEFGPTYRFSGVLDVRDMNPSPRNPVLSLISKLLKVSLFGPPSIVNRGNYFLTSLQKESGQLGLSCIERRDGVMPTTQQITAVLNAHKVIENLNANKFIHGDLIPPTCPPP